MMRGDDSSLTSSKGDRADDKGVGQAGETSTPAPTREEPLAGSLSLGATRAVQWLLGGVVLAVLILAIASQGRLGVGVLELSSARTFSFSLLIGIAGAFVYLTLLLIADKDLNVLKRIWESDKLPKGVMVPLFLISGGVVAAMSEISTDDFARGDIWGIFLLGFGWLGAMSGVGGASVSKTSAEAIGKKNAELRAKDITIESKEKEWEAFKAKKGQEMERYILDMAEFFDKRAQKQSPAGSGAGAVSTPTPVIPPGGGSTDQTPRKGPDETQERE